MSRAALDAPTATERRWLVILSVAALLVRWIWVLELESLPWGEELPTDSSLYDAAARRIAAGDWLLGPHPLRMSPGYFYALGVVYRVFGAEPLAMRIVQSTLGASSVLLSWALAREVLPRGKAWPRLLAAALGGFVGPLVFFDGAILPESIASVLLLASALATVHAVADERDVPREAWRWGVAALLLGLLSLFRPNAALLFPILVALALRGGEPREKLTRALVVLAVLAAALAPLTARNWVASGRLVPLTSHGGLNLYIGSGPGATGTFRVPPEVPDGGSPETQFEAFRRAASEAVGHPLDEAEADRYWVMRTLEHVLEEPGAALILFARKLHLIFNARELGLVLPYAFAREATRTIGAPLVQSGWVAPLGLVGILWALFAPSPSEAQLRARRRRVRALALVAFAFVVSIALVFVTDRYRAPLVPLFALFSVFMALELQGLAARGERRALGLHVAALALALVLAIPAAGDPHFERDWVAFGEHFLAHEEPERALDAFERALALTPQSALASLGAAQASLALGDRGAARRLFAQVIDDPSAPAQLQARARAALDRLSAVDRR